MEAWNLDFNEWYKRQAFLKINQAIGRIKWHLNDFGAAIFIDERFESLEF